MSFYYWFLKSQPSLFFSSSSYIQDWLNSEFTFFDNGKMEELKFTFTQVCPSMWVPPSNNFWFFGCVDIDILFVFVKQEEQN